MEKASQPGDKYIVRFPEGLRDRIAEEARKNNRSMNGEIVHRLLHSLQSDRDASGIEEQVERLSSHLTRLLQDVDRLTAKIERTKKRRQSNESEESE